MLILQDVYILNVYFQLCQLKKCVEFVLHMHRFASARFVCGCHNFTKSLRVVFSFYSRLYGYTHFSSDIVQTNNKKTDLMPRCCDCIVLSTESQLVWLCQKQTAGPFPASWRVGQLKQKDERLSSSKTTRSLALAGAVHDVWWRWMKMVAIAKDRTLQILWRSFWQDRSNRVCWHAAIHIIVEQSGNCACLM